MFRPSLALLTPFLILVLAPATLAQGIDPLSPETLERVREPTRHFAIDDAFVVATFEDLLVGTKGELSSFDRFLRPESPSAARSAFGSMKQVAEDLFAEFRRLTEESQKAHADQLEYSRVLSENRKLLAAKKITEEEFRARYPRRPFVIPTGVKDRFERAWTTTFEQARTAGHDPAVLSNLATSVLAALRDRDDQDYRKIMASRPKPLPPLPRIEKPTRVPECSPTTGAMRQYFEQSTRERALTAADIEGFFESIRFRHDRERMPGDLQRRRSNLFLLFQMGYRQYLRGPHTQPADAFVSAYVAHLKVEAHSTPRDVIPIKCDLAFDLLNLLGRGDVHLPTEVQNAEEEPGTALPAT
ncbi:MAG TPA: hypothetical protein VM598_08930 [Bdellovibrionota bacterium]|nr:hypothetical protein [Bdellovibrionota bacterium]